MIEKLYIKNFAIIDEIEINFLPGLTVVTGETGSGKSILLKALSLVLGGKADKIMVRNSTERAVVEVRFHNTEIRRVLSNTGRTKTYKDDEFVSLIDLKKDNNTRVDFHGQHDQQFILDKNSHIDYLDRYCGHQSEVIGLEKIFNELIDLRLKLNDLKENENLKKERLELLNYQVNEIEMVAPKTGEDHKIKESYKKLSNLEEILKSLKNIKSSISDSDHSLIGQLSFTYQQLMRIEKYDSNIKKISSLISDSILQLEEANTEIISQLMELDLNSDELISLEERLNALEALKRKYGGSIEAVILEKEKIKKEIKLLNNVEKSQNDIMNLIKEKENCFSQKAKSIHKRRKLQSKKLSQKVMNAMVDLNMHGSCFDIVINQEENIDGFVNYNGKKINANSKGMDKVEFYLSANPGEPTKPLISVASGGEISRIMLAIKTVFQDIDPVDTLVFDEIDSGISGKAAEKVSMHLLHLSRKKQVICITHLSQIANQADHHLHLIKYVKGAKTYVDIKYLNNLESSKIIQELFIGTEKTYSA